MNTSQDLSQTQSGELRRSFLRHLPQRVERIRKRATRLCQEGWDINELSLLYQEIQTLAGAAGNHGLMELSDQLFSIEVYLSSFTESAIVPREEHNEEIMRLVGGLNVSGITDLEDEADLEADDEPLAALEEEYQADAVLVDDADEIDRESFDDLDDEADEVDESWALELLSELEEDEGGELVESGDDGGGQAELPEGGRADQEQDGEDIFGEAELEDETPPVDPAETDSQADDLAFDEESVDDLARPDEDPDSGGQESPDPQDQSSPELEATEEPAPETPVDVNQIYLLTSMSSDLGDLRGALSSRGLAVERFGSVVEALDQVDRLHPGGIVLDSGFLEQIEELADALRQRQAKTPLIVVAETESLQRRLAGMRAGASAFFSPSDSAKELALRIHEVVSEGESENYRVLIVEDDRSQAVFAASILRKSGMEAETVMNPYKVLESLERFRPDLLLMDLHMPGADGMEMTAIIRERDAFLYTPIVFLSGEQDEDAHFDALSAGGDDFLSKPIRPRHLISAVKNRIRRAKRVARQKSDEHVDQADAHTGLHQRRYLLDQINARLSEESVACTALFIEIDAPTVLRDQIGLTGMDPVLESLGGLLQEALPDESLVAQFGDFSFAALVDETDPDSLEQLGQALHRSVEEHVFEVDDKSLSMTVSIGLCVAARRFSDAGSLLAAAEKACLAVRNESQTGVRLHQAKVTDSPAAEQAVLTELIEHAIEKDDFQILYQPVVSLQGGNDEIYQTILRLAGEDQVYTMDKLRPIAQKSGLMAQVDRWVCNQSLRVLDRHHRNKRAVRVFADQSIASVEEDSFCQWLGNQLATRDIEGQWLVLEYPAPDLAAKLKEARDFFQSLREFKVRVCLSEFSLSSRDRQTLRHVGADYVKLASSALSNLNQRHTDAGLGKFIEEIHSKGGSVIVPGVENAQIVTRLWSAGVDFIQGNFVQQPTADLGFDFDRESP